MNLLGLRILIGLLLAAPHPKLTVERSDCSATAWYGYTVQCTASVRTTRHEDWLITCGQRGPDTNLCAKLNVGTTYAFEDLNAATAQCRPVPSGNRCIKIYSLPFDVVYTVPKEGQ